MCGICGIAHTDRERPVDRGLLDRMRDTLRHRGPDDAGTRIFPGVGLAHRRLSIIDLSPDGHQPMSNEDGSVWITYNGEVYNFAQLRHELEGRGHVFRSRSDTETIVHLYEEHGPACLGRLRGMFALAIWDEKKRQLLLARDRIGIKPLYYYHCDGMIVFASELRSLLAHPDVPREIDLGAVDAYLSMLVVPGDDSIFRNVRRLPPGSHAVWCDGRLTVSPYWQLAGDAAAACGTPDLDELQSLLEDAVRARLVSDVPLGVFLSGGIDSGLVTALAARVSPDPVKTFTISFRDTPLDESAYARQVSERYGTQHTETVLEPDALGIDLVQRLGAHFDEPFADASAIPMYLLSETTRAHVTVALSGDGGDELFAGYQLNQSYTRIAAMQSAVPRMLRPAVSATARHGIEPLARLLRSERLRRVAKAGGWVGSSPLDLIVQLGSYWVDREKRRLYGPRMKDVAIGEHAGCWMARRCGEWPVRPDLKTCLYAELRTTLADDMLVKADRMSMYHALEIRVPLLDHHVVEHAFSLDADEFLRGSTGKLPLRDLARRLLPEGLVDRPKQGFHVPLESLGGDKLASFARDTLNSDRMRRDGFFAPEAAEELIVAYEDRHERGRGNVSRYQINHRLWSLLMFTMWLDSWSGGSPSAADRPRAIDVGSGVM